MRLAGDPWRACIGPGTSAVAAEVARPRDVDNQKRQIDRSFPLSAIALAIAKQVIIPTTVRRYARLARWSTTVNEV
jgi:hypothetical protein